MTSMIRSAVQSGHWQLTSKTVGLMDDDRFSYELASDGMSAFLRGDLLERFLEGVVVMPDRARV